MSNYTISNILHTFIFISDSIFIGLKILVPLIFILEILNIKYTKPNLNILILTINLIMLSASILFLTSISINTLLTIKSGNSDELNFMISVATGSHWFQFVIPIILFGLLPNILWIKNFRKSIYIPFFIVICWFASYFIIHYLSDRDFTLFSAFFNHSPFPYMEYLKKIIIFILLFIICFRLIKLRNQKMKIQ